MLREAISLSALVTGWYSVWCAIPGAAQASELTPWNSPVISGTVAWLILGYAFCACLALFIVLRIFAIAPRDDDDVGYPDPEQDRPIKYEDFRQ